jgi:hypothetical protein
MRNLRPYGCSIAFAFVLAAMLVLVAEFSLAQAPQPDTQAIELKARELLSKLTFEEKIKPIGGVDSMFTNTAPSINFPPLKMSDASAGVRAWGPPMPTSVVCRRPLAGTQSLPGSRASCSAWIPTLVASTSFWDQHQHCPRLGWWSQP